MSELNLLKAIYTKLTATQTAGSFYADLGGRIRLGDDGAHHRRAGGGRHHLDDDAGDVAVFERQEAVADGV